MQSEKYEMNSWKICKFKSISVSEISKKLVNEGLEGYLEQFLSQKIYIQPWNSQ